VGLGDGASSTAVIPAGSDTSAFDAPDPQAVQNLESSANPFPQLAQKPMRPPIVRPEFYHISNKNKIQSIQPEEINCSDSASDQLRPASALTLLSY
jgi:hypothetical protein